MRSKYMFDFKKMFNKIKSDIKGMYYIINKK